MKIAIVALGWLGESIYDYWQDQGHEVTGTYHSRAKSKTHELQYDFNNEPIPNEIKDAQLIFFNLPPSKIESLQRFESFLNGLEDKCFVFISSTSVYADQGKVDETSSTESKSSNGLYLLELENIVKETIRNHYIIRPAGLIGGDRHPGKFLSGRQSKSAPNQSVNLVEKKDLIHLIDKVINQDKVRIINAVNTHHPNKKQYYTKYCKQHNLKAPIFLGPDSQQDKIVSTCFKEFEIKSELP